MAITSVGYAGTVGEVQWSNMVPRVGSTFYSVDDYASFKVSISAGTRAVSVAAGGASAVGVWDVSNAPVTLNLDTVSSGNRWDMVVIRRTWATKVTSLVVIQGSSTMALPSRNTTVGTVHDQPIALARVAAGSTVVQEVIDLRCIGGDGGLTAFHDLARSYLDRVGTSVRINGTVWDRQIGSMGSPEWISSPDTTVQHQTMGAPVTGISIPGGTASGGVLIKTGQVTDFGTPAFGNQYMSTVTFTNPFPRGILSVQVTQLDTSEVDSAPLIAVDDVRAGGFRAFYPGQNASVKRSFMWTAIGY